MDSIEKIKHSCYNSRIMSFSNSSIEMFQAELELIESMDIVEFNRLYLSIASAVNKNPEISRNPMAGVPFRYLPKIATPDDYPETARLRTGRSGSGYEYGLSVVNEGARFLAAYGVVAFAGVSIEYADQELYVLTVNNKRHHATHIKSGLPLSSEKYDQMLKVIDYLH